MAKLLKIMKNIGLNENRIPLLLKAISVTPAFRVLFRGIHIPVLNIRIAYRIGTYLECCGGPTFLNVRLFVSYCWYYILSLFSKSTNPLPTICF